MISGCIHWSQPPFAFELCSSDNMLLERAATIFLPWRVQTVLPPTHRWRVEPVPPDHSDQLDHPTQPGQTVQWEVQAEGEDGCLRRPTAERALTAVELLAIQAVLETPSRLLTLHSALVSKGGRGVLILGPGEAGKSTLACALWQVGWELLCDDVALVEPETGWAHPTPRRVSVRNPSRTLLGEELWTRILASPSCTQTDEGYVFHPNEVDHTARPAASQLAAIIFLARQGSQAGPPTLHRIDPAYALLSLVPYSNFGRQLGLGEALRRIRPLAATVPAYDLGRTQLPLMVQEIDAVIDALIDSPGTRSREADC